MKHKNNTLNKAKVAKNDEFYTTLSDIEKELKHYKKHFKNKVVYCNCDDPRESKFFHYFSYNFEKLGLKKLITTCYKSEDGINRSKNNSKKAALLVYEGDKNGNRIPDAEEIGIKSLIGDGDFRNEENIKLLNEADIVVSNPPFSLFKEYLAQLVKYNKKFLIVGNMTAIKNKDSFPLIQQGKIWMGNTAGMTFSIPGSNVTKKLGFACWFTNLTLAKRNEEIILTKKYNKKDYKKLDNIDALFIEKVKDIPMDYKGILAVPISFIFKHSAKQFEIIDVLHPGGGVLSGKSKCGSPLLLNGVPKFTKMLIRNKKVIK